MADWKQITARIRRARGSKDPAAQLSNLFTKTGDAMVAFELARFFETSGQNAESAKWYSSAAERFRRADWKTKAQEAAVRLAAMPAQTAPLPTDTLSEAAAPSVTMPEAGLPFEQNAATFEAIASPEPVFSSNDSSSESAGSSASSAPANKRRRGRRGGRNRRKSPQVRSSSTTLEAQSSPSSSVSSDVSEDARSSSVPEPSFPRLPAESFSEGIGSAPRGRLGDPGLSSRLTLLEMQFRRLLGCAPAKLMEADHAPVGPGVFLLTDSDQTSYYYVEACQTLRLAISNLARSGASRRGADSIKPKLAEHLGIAETRVAKYVNDHCVVRWLQLDDGAAHFAHYVIAVLHPALNE